MAGDARLTTGSDDFPVALAQGWSARSGPGKSGLSVPPGTSHIAVIAGSCTPRTVRQLARFETTHPVRRIDLLEARGDGNLGDEVVDWARSRLTQGPVGVATTADAEGVKRAQAELGQEGASALADDILGSVARGLYGHGVRKFVIAGGETSGTVMAALGVDKVAVGPYDELEGGFCQRTGDDPLSLVLKAGSAGSDDFLNLALARLQVPRAESTDE